MRIWNAMDAHLARNPKARLACSGCNGCTLGMCGCSSCPMTANPGASPRRLLSLLDSCFARRGGLHIVRRVGTSMARLLQVSAAALLQCATKLLQTFVHAHSHRVSALHRKAVCVATAPNSKGTSTETYSEAVSPSFAQERASACLEMCNHAGDVRDFQLSTL
jgi:hypothetical protein